MAQDHKPSAIELCLVCGRIVVIVSFLILVPRKLQSTCNFYVGLLIYVLDRGGYLGDMNLSLALPNAVNVMDSHRK